MTGDAEHALAGLSGGPTDLSLRRRQRQYEALAEVALTALQETDLDTVLAFAAQRLQHALACDYVKILDARVSATGLLVRSGAGWPDGIVGRTEVADDAASMGGYTLQVGETVLVEDLATEERFTPAALLIEHDVRSGVAVVIDGEPEPIGVIEADSRSPGHFSATDASIIEAYAKVLGIAIRQHEREQMSADFAAIASHELRTPLTLLIGYSSRLLRQLDEHGSITPDQREELEILYSESLRLRRSTDIFLALGELERRGATPGVARVDLVATARSAVKEVGLRFPASPVRVEAETPTVMWTTDEVSVGRIVGNLVENAAKYSPEGSELAVRVAADETGASISVADRCGGLSPADFSRLFGRSFRGGHSGLGKGLGLGLYVSQRLAERLGGSLGAENQDAGCVFTLRLPVEPPGTSRDRRA